MAIDQLFIEITLFQKISLNFIIKIANNIKERKLNI